MSRPSATESVRRLLSLIPYVASRAEGVPLDELCERFAISRRQLVADIEILPFVGVHPFTADMLLDVVVEEDTVWVHPQWLDRPLRLTPAQGLAVLAAGDSLLDVQGADPDGPLARALDKVGTAIGVRGGRELDVQLGPADPATLRALSDATEHRRVVRLDYYSFDRDARTQREVEPWNVFTDSGSWYMEGWCRLAEGPRLFRLDRIASIELLDENASVTRSPRGTDTFHPAPDDPSIELELTAGSGWVLERYPARSVVELDDGSVRVVFAVSAPAWLERLLLQLGNRAQVVAGPHTDPVFEHLGRRAAQRVLTRYR